MRYILLLMLAGCSSGASEHAAKLVRGTAHTEYRTVCIDGSLYFVDNYGLPSSPVMLNNTGVTSEGHIILTPTAQVQECK